MQIACSHCGNLISHNSSALCDNTVRQTVVSLALRLATFIAGIGFAGYHKLLKHYLGMHVVNRRHFYHVIEMAYPHVKDILDEVCELGKEEMKYLPSTQLGSWEKAVMTSDGCSSVRTARLSSTII